MIKGILLSKDGIKLSEVYSKEILSKLQEYNIDISKVYTQSDIGSIDFSSVEFIFSTWSMPCLSEVEVNSFFPSLKAVFYAAGTVKYFARPFIANGVEIFNADYANGISVADYVTGQILLASKGYYQSQQLYKKKRYRKAREIAYRHVGNYDTNIGIIGAGKIGKKVIENLFPYRVNVFVYDPLFSEEDEMKYGCRRVDLDELFIVCDVISNHLPDITSTVGVLNYDLFKLMKNNSTFINTGRGRQVDEKGLIKKLKNDKSICALLDVTTREPLIPWSRFFFMKNIFLTPHIAGSTNREQQRMGEYILDVFEDYVLGNKSFHSVSIEMLDKMT